MKQLAQISVLALAAFALWLALPRVPSDRAESTRPVPVDRGGAPEAARSPAEDQTSRAGRADGAVAGGAALQPAAPARGEDVAAFAGRDAPDLTPGEAVRVRLDEGLGRSVDTPSGRRADSDRADSDRPGVERAGDVAAPSEPSPRLILRSDLPAPDPIQVEQLVEQAVPDGSLPPGELEAARDAARADIVEDQLIADTLARNSLGDDPTEAELRARRDIADTLLSTLTPAERERVRQRTADQINSQR